MKVTKFLSYLATMAMVISCAKEIHQEQVIQQNGITRINASLADTKTVLGSDGTSILWSPNDEISVFYNTAGVKFTAINTKPVDQTIFVSDKAVVYGGTEGYLKSYLYGIYPYSAANAQDDDVITLAVPSSQTAVEGSFGRGAFPSVGRSKTTDIAFYNVCGGVCFSLTQSGVRYVTFRGNNNESLAGTINVQFNGSGIPEVAEVVSGSTSIQLSAPTSAGFTVGRMYYFSVLPQTLSGGFTMEFNKASAKATKIVSSSVEVKRSIFGKLSDADQGLEYISTGEAEDLSFTGTANCYIVSKAGDYKFKATVKGNSTESVGTPASVETLWESFGTDVTPTAGDLVYGVSLDNGYVKFTASDKNGNAVIAVKDASDNILWSWHIWICKDFDPAATSQVYNKSAGTMMDRNLGATSATKGDVHALGLLYQWGRKDPFLSGDSISSSTQAASTLSWPSAVASNSSNGTIAYAVAHPTTFITSNSTNHDWYYTGSSSTDNTRWQSPKTMYDPCPHGWRVPDGGSSGVWSTAFETSSNWTTASNWDSTNKGMDFGKTDKTLGSGTIWYPAAGYRESSNGGPLINVGSIGCYWSCTHYECNAYFLLFSNDGYVNPSHTNYRAFGRSVRCITE